MYSVYSAIFYCQIWYDGDFLLAKELVLYILLMFVFFCLRVLLTVVAGLSSYSIHLLLKSSGIVGTCVALQSASSDYQTSKLPFMHNKFLCIYLYNRICSLDPVQELVTVYFIH